MGYLKERGYRLALLTGGFDITAQHIAVTLGIEHYRACTSCIFDIKSQSAKLISTGEERVVKLRHLQELCAQQHLPISSCACVGDGDNNLDIFKGTGHGIAFIHSGDTVRQVAEHTITTLSDLRNLF